MAESSAMMHVIALVRQGFPFQKFFLAGKVLAGQADDDFIGVHINDGIAHGAHILDMLSHVKPANPANADIVLPDEK